MIDAMRRVLRCAQTNSKIPPRHLNSTRSTASKPTATPASIKVSSHSGEISRLTASSPRQTVQPIFTSQRFVGRSLRSPFPRVLVIQNNHDREQRKNQHVIFLLR